MQTAQNFKFLNKPPMILGHEFFDCAQAAFFSMLLFVITSSHLLALITGLSIVVMKSGYKKLYPKNTIYFFRNKKEGVAIKFLLNTKNNVQAISEGNL